MLLLILKNLPNISVVFSGSFFWIYFLLFLLLSILTSHTRKTKSTFWMQSMHNEHTNIFGSIRDDPYWTSRKSGLELIELSSINKVSLVLILTPEKTLR
jgi:hypothetical protein